MRTLRLIATCLFVIIVELPSTYVIVERRSTLLIRPHSNGVLPATPLKAVASGRTAQPAILNLSICVPLTCYMCHLCFGETIMKIDVDYIQVAGTLPILL